MKKYVCTYIIEALDLNNEVKEYCGLVQCDSFTEAVSYLENKLYGDDFLSIKEMELFDTSIELSKEVYALVKKELNEL